MDGKQDHELRIDGDAGPYTKEEFLHFYGNTLEWDNAKVWSGDGSELDVGGISASVDHLSIGPAGVHGPKRQVSMYNRGVNVQPVRKRLINFRRKSQLIMPVNLVINSVSMTEADKVLTNDGRDGCFFFRKSTADSGSIVLSMCWQKTPHHFIMKFPDDPKTSVQLEEFLNSFAKKHSKGSGILLPGALKYYIPHTISAHESLGSIPESAATEIAKVLDLAYADIGGEEADVAALSDDYADITEVGYGAKMDPHSSGGGPAPPSTPPGGRIVMEDDPVYDEYSPTKSKDVYATVSPKHNAYADPQDALGNGGCSVATEQPAAPACPDEVAPPLMPKLQTSRLASQLRKMTKWEKEDEGTDSVDSNEYADIEGSEHDCDSGEEAVLPVKVVPDLGVPSHQPFSNSLRRNKRGAIKNLHRHSTADENSPNESAL